MSITIHGGRVANAFGCNTLHVNLELHLHFYILEVMGSRPSFGDNSEIHFLESIQSLAQRDLKWSVETNTFAKFGWNPSSRGRSTHT